ncbi:hypothetical protein [Roseovarius sp.]|uniref:hypothetical protein n=1 Tax=Roseovarius sp. TaxID=1486281 RepID=UPI003564D194
MHAFEGPFPESKDIDCMPSFNKARNLVQNERIRNLGKKRNQKCDTERPTSSFVSLGWHHHVEFTIYRIIFGGDDPLNSPSAAKASLLLFDLSRMTLKTS